MVTYDRRIGKAETESTETLKALQNADATTVMWSNAIWSIYHDDSSDKASEMWWHLTKLDRARNEITHPFELLQERG